MKALGLVPLIAIAGAMMLAAGSHRLDLFVLVWIGSGVLGGLCAPFLERRIAT